MLPQARSPPEGKLTTIGMLKMSPDDTHASALPPEIGPNAAAASPAVGSTPVTYRPEFTAEGKEYFRIWIVNLALTVVTLGLYSAWAKVRKLRYIYSNTTLAGSAFGYHGEPLKILKGRLIATTVGAGYFAATRYSPIAALVVVLLIGSIAPWLVVKSRIFALRMTSWRGIRFGFLPDFSGAYRAILGWAVAGMVTLGILWPRAVRERMRFIVSRSLFGTTRFECEPRIGRFYKTAGVLIGVGVLWAIAVGIIVGATVFANRGKGTPMKAMQGIGMLVTIILYVALFAVMKAYTQSRNLNEVFNTTRLGPHRFKSRLRARTLIWIYITNAMGILVTLGLFTPWAQLRLVRYRLSTLELETHGSLDAFAAAAASRAPGAAGEEISDFLDVDFGL